MRPASLLSALPDFGFALVFLSFALTGWSELYDHAWLQAERFVRG